MTLHDIELDTDALSYEGKFFVFLINTSKKGQTIPYYDDCYAAQQLMEKMKG